MKLTVLGGGGVRSPFLAKYIAGRARKLKIDHIVFMDNDPDKLRLFGGLSKKVAGIVDPELRFDITTSPEEALEGADFVITSLRVGKDISRVSDERGALNEGVIGQETTGAGGFAMAMRSVPALVDYCRLIRQHAKADVRILNFTNPSGLVTQTLRSEGFDNVYGICDGPNGFLKEVAKLLEISSEMLSVSCYGLNHLSWFKNIRVNGSDITRELIRNPRLYSDTEMRVFDPGLLERMGVIPNAYLYYYYHREKAIGNILKSGKTRGETIVAINEQMIKALSGLDVETDFEKMLRIYLEHYFMRESSYMAIESGKSHAAGAEQVSLQDIFRMEFGAGYAGVALDFIEALTTGKEAEIILSVPNNGAISGLRDDDVVEITCRVDSNGVQPVKVGDIPELQLSLVRQVKLYERLAAQAIKDRSINLAIDALMIHPLVNSYSIAKKLVMGYSGEYKEYAGHWR